MTDILLLLFKNYFLYSNTKAGCWTNCFKLCYPYKSVRRDAYLSFVDENVFWIRKKCVCTESDNDWFWYCCSYCIVTFVIGACFYLLKRPVSFHFFSSCFLNSSLLRQFYTFCCLSFSVEPYVLFIVNSFNTWYTLVLIKRNPCFEAPDIRCVYNMVPLILCLFLGIIIDNGTVKYFRVKRKKMHKLFTQSWFTPWQFLGKLGIQFYLTCNFYIVKDIGLKLITRSAADNLSK
jgi:hypothetical protein